MAASGIERIDKLLSGEAPPVGSDAPAEAIAAIQDLLRGHGANVPGLRVPGYGQFGPRTVKAIQSFRRVNQLPEAATVDRQMLEKLVNLRATNPVVSRPYLTLKLNKEYKGLPKLVSLVAIVEGAGRFAAMCFNTDQAGLSVGIIQWAQKPGRLAEIVEQWWDKNAGDVLRQILGFRSGNDPEFKRLLDHLKSKRGGTAGNPKNPNDPKPGETINPVFDLIRDPWRSRFREACLNPRLQELQVDAAISAFRTSHQQIQTKMPLLKSELAVAFTIDLANQFGDGGAKRIYDHAVGLAGAGATERQVLEKMRDRSVDRLKELFPKQPSIPKAGEDRRNFFLNESGLSTDPFEP